MKKLPWLIAKNRAGSYQHKLCQATKGLIFNKLGKLVRSFLLRRTLESHYNSARHKAAVPKRGEATD
jgi:hypothetical protein